MAAIGPQTWIGHVHLEVGDLDRALGFYLQVPDSNGVELYWDTPHETWPCTCEGELTMVTRPLDLRALLAEAPAPS